MSDQKGALDVQSDALSRQTRQTAARRDEGSGHRPRRVTCRCTSRGPALR
jgi:hypothetical protein